MKSLFTLIVFILGQPWCYAQHDSLYIKVHIKTDSEYVKSYSTKTKYIQRMIKENNYVAKGDSMHEKHYNISVTITNTSDTMITIYLMSCSWTDNLMVNNRYMYLPGAECDSNFPEAVEFKPGESKTYKTTLRKSMKFDYRSQRLGNWPEVEVTKLGLILVKDLFGRDPGVNYFLAMDDKSQ